MGRRGEKKYGDSGGEKPSSVISYIRKLKKKMPKKDSDNILVKQEQALMLPFPHYLLILSPASPAVRLHPETWQGWGMGRIQAKRE